MKTDWYLKTILTVIALALTVLVLQNMDVITQVKANNKANLPNEVIEVKVVDWQVRNNVNVNIDEVGGWYVSNGALKVSNE